MVGDRVKRLIGLGRVVVGPELSMGPALEH